MAGRKASRRSTGPRIARAVSAGSGIAVAATVLSGSIGEAATVLKVTVTSLNDTSTPSATNVVNGQAPTLADAIAYLDTKTTGGAITFASTLSGSLNLTSKLPTITEPMAIVGPGANKLTIHNTVTGAPAFALDTPQPSGFADLTITGGQEGAIYSRYSRLILKDVTIAGNSSFYGGGGVLAFETDVVIDSSQISDNTVSGTKGSGGGLYELGNGTVVVHNSTISGNHAPYGAGIATSGVGTTVIYGSTVSANHATVNGGGLAFRTPFKTGEANIYVENSTIAHNIADGSSGGMYLGHHQQVGAITGTVVGSTIVDNLAKTGPGGGIGVGFAKLKLDDSIVATNKSDLIGAASSPDIAIAGTGPLHQVVAKFSLIGDGSRTLAKSLVTNKTDIVGTAKHRANPELRPLRNNGGPTKTMVPMRRSRALGTGNAVSFLKAVPVIRFNVDQRGRPRVGLAFGAKTPDGTDMGAVEVSRPTQTKSFTKGNQRFSLTTAAKSRRLNPSRPLPVTYGSQQLPYHSPQLHFKRIKLSISGRSSTIASTHPNRTVKLKLRGLAAGHHTLRATVTYTYQSGGRTLQFTQTLRGGVTLR